MYLAIFNTAKVRVSDVYIAWEKGIYLSDYKDKRLLNLLIPKSGPST